ncbi:thioredoxin [Candidatus Woesearchaeota archaeon]|nr:thioredoxin [Candidatus Woesearchaeota archaeon]
MKELNAENFKDFVKEGNVIVDFWAEWCGPCRMLGPIFEELSKEIKNVKFAKLNVDEAGEISASAGVRGIPTMILFKDGNEIDRIVGALSKDALKSKLTSAFN